MTDNALLEQFVRDGGPGGESAFTELVRRHIDLVYSVALRQARDQHLAEDVAQAVFVILAQKARAGRLARGTVLAGWLFHTTRYEAANAVKREARRRKRETALMHAGTMFRQDSNDDPAQLDWDREIAPALDRALERLGAGERDALLLRYMEERNLSEVAATMGVSVDAARKRIERGLTKLRRLLGAAGVAAPSVAGLAVLLSEHAAVAAPPALAGTVAASACAGAGATTATVLAKSAISGVLWAKAKMVACFLALTLTGIGATLAVSKHFSAQAPTRPPTGQAMAQPVAQIAAPANPAKAQVLNDGTVQIDGVIMTPDDTPAAGAEVFVAMPVDPAYEAAMRQIEARQAAKQNVPRDQWPVLREKRVDVYGAWPTETQTTDARGKFVYGGVKEPWILVIRHPSGYAEMTDEEFKRARGQVWLKAYGQVEGTFFRGSDAMPGQKVMLFRYVRSGGWEVEQVRQERFVRTDNDGKFLFENVCPGDDLWLAWERPGRPVVRDHYFPIDVAPGKTLRQDLGGKGRAVIGRVATVPANAPNETLSWAGVNKDNVMATYNSTGYSEWFAATFKKPPGFEQMTRVEQMKHEREFFKSPAARDRQRIPWGRTIDLQADGSFRIEDVPPGTYQTNFRIFDEANGFSEDVVECRPQFTVPQFPPGVTRMEQPLDLGTIPVTLKPRALVGTMAPDFEAITIEGKLLKLSDYRGKYVFLKIWWPYSEMEIEVPAISKAWETMQKQGNWVLITIGFDKEMATTRKRMADHPMPGIHCQFEDSLKFPKGYMGSPSSIHIIGPDGKVLARKIQPLDAQKAVMDVLRER